MKVLVLEDNKYRIEKFKQLFSYQELVFVDDIQIAYKLCQTNEFDVLMLDHDLDGRIWVDSNDENTGYQFVKKIVNNIDHKITKQTIIYVHSMNPIGANKMVNLLRDNGYDGIWIPAFMIIGAI
jgi:CheY-like chemotaxis protein